MLKIFPRGDASLVRYSCALFIGLFALTPTNTSAITFDFDGRGTLNAEKMIGFESGEELPDMFHFSSTGLVDASFVDVAQGLEGDKALEVGGEYPQLLIDTTTFELSGRRVEVKLWVLPQGTDVAVGLRWIAGDPVAMIQESDFRKGWNIAFLRFTKTGRVTSDGWVEFTSGPIDWTYSGAIDASYISITDLQPRRRGSPETTHSNPNQQLLSTRSKSKISDRRFTRVSRVHWRQIRRVWGRRLCNGTLHRRGAGLGAPWVRNHQRRLPR